MYSLGAEVYLYCRLCLGTVTNIIETFVFRKGNVCSDVLGSEMCYWISGSFINSVI